MWNSNPLKRIRQWFAKKPSIADLRDIYETDKLAFYKTLGEISTLNKQYQSFIDAIVLSQRIITPMMVRTFRKTSKSPKVILKETSPERLAMRKIMQAAMDKLVPYQNEVVMHLNDIPSFLLGNIEEFTEKDYLDHNKKLKMTTEKNRKILEAHSVFLLSLKTISGIFDLAWKLYYEETGLSEPKLIREITDTDPYVKYVTENNEPKIKLRTN